MAITKFMQAMFSANEREDEELAGQVAEDIESAKENGEVDTDEVNYKHLGDGNVMIHDKVNDEVTLAKKAQDEHETYDLVAVPTEDLDMYLHMAEDGVTPDESVEGVDEEHYEEHMEAPMDYMEDEYVDGSELNDEGCEECEEEEKEFSYYGDNVVLQRLFSDQIFMEKIFNEVIESEETAKVGDIKVEKIDDDTVLVTSEATGDQARIEVQGEHLKVDELEQREMSEEDYEDEECYNGCGSSEQYEPMFVVGVDAGNLVIVDAPVYNEEDAQDLASRLEESGVEGIGIFENPDEAREHAEELLNSLGVEHEDQVGEPEQAEFSDYGVYVTRYFSYDELEEIENEYYERLFSEIDPEDCTKFMLKMFSETEDNAPSQEKIEDALESGEEIEEDGEVITPISDDTVVVEDKNNGEFTKIVLDDEDMDIEKISREEAEELVKDIAVESEEEEEEDKEEEKEFSEVFVDPFELDSSEVTSYMMRLFSESEDDDESLQEDVESALEDGEQVETDDEIITPISDDTAVVEDKENGEYTKVTVDGEDMHVEKLSESEAEDLLGDVEVEETKEEQEEREFSENNSMILKFFADAMVPAQAPVAPVPAEVAPVPAPVEAIPAPMPMDMPVEVPSVEAIEDKALAAVEAIHAAAQDASNMIQQAKDAPVPGAEEDLQEAQFSYYWNEEDAEERFYSETETLGSWLTNNIR